jgi:hypothetical protein
MTTSSIRTTLAGLAIMAIATIAAAQDRAALLTSIEVRQLAASGLREDHARLRDHFAALAEKYLADANRHKVLAQVSTGNPNHPVIGARQHHLRWADAATTSASTLRELSAHHGRLANGQASEAPASSARFENGEGAAAPTDAQLRELSAGARTPSDHRALEEYFSELAQKYTREAQEHAAMAQRYRLHPNDRAGSFRALAVHCDRLAKQSREAARRAEVAATEHRL